jgi:hypothetical protein
MPQPHNANTQVDKAQSSNAVRDCGTGSEEFFWCGERPGISTLWLGSAVGTTAADTGLTGGGCSRSLPAAATATAVPRDTTNLSDNPAVASGIQPAAAAAAATTNNATQPLNAAAESVGRLLRWVSNLVPPKTPILLLATAGLRLVDKEDQVKVSCCCEYAASTH